MAICLTAEKFTQRISDERKLSRWTKSLQMGWHIQRKIPYKQGGMTCHYPAHLGQSSQNSKRNVDYIRGRSPSESLGALNANPDRGLRTVKHFLEVPQTLATRGSDKSPQNPSHRMTPIQSFNLWKLFPNWVDLKNPRGFSPVKLPPLQQTGNNVYFPNKRKDSPSWVCLSDY